MTDKKWKALTLPFETFAAYDDTEECYILSRRTVQMFLAFVDYAAWKTRWYKTDNTALSDSDADLIKAWAGQAAYELMTTIGCAEDGDCVEWNNLSRVIDYFPNHPGDQTTPPGYLFPPWYIAPDFNLIGAVTGAAVTDITRFPYAPGTPAETLPRFRVLFSGIGTVELHLITIYAGGNAIIQVDGDLAQIEIVDLNQDILSVPPETQDVVIIERKFETEGDHFIDVTMIPVLNDGIPPVLFGGGLMKVVFCGLNEPDGEIIDFLGGCDDMAQFRMCWFYDSTGNKILRYTLNDGCSWVDVGLCDDSVVPIEPVIPVIDPEDKPGETPDLYLTPEARCRIINETYFDVFNRAQSFFSTVINGTPSARAYNLSLWLDGLSDSSNGLEWYPKFKLFVEKYVPFIVNIENVMEGATWPDVVACIVSACVPIDPSPTRAVMDCMADGLDASRPPVETDPDNYYMYSYYADFWRVFPLSVVRSDAFKDALNDAISSECPDCGEEPGDCLPKLITFDVGGDAYSINVGTLTIGRDGQGLRNIQVADDSLIPGYGGVTTWALKLTIPMDGVCNITGISYRAVSRTTPELNANNHGFGIVWRVQIYNGETLTHDAVYADIGLYYYLYIDSDWLTWSRGFSSPVAGDSVVLSVLQGAGAGYTEIETIIDDVIVTVEE